jgi:hypothetical protein
MAISVFGISGVTAGIPDLLGSLLTSATAWCGA